jgi:ubiquinone/menaquinone biosynthesis C-methylase UbiE
MARTKRQDSRSAIQRDHGTRGRLLDRGWRFDLEVWTFDTFLVGGTIRQLRQRVLELAQLCRGQAVLDVGCGTGTLAIAAAVLVGQDGEVAGIDPAPRQIGRAQSKARRAGVHVDFRPGVIEGIPYPDQSFDAVTSTLMMHHLPSDLKRKGLAEIIRVLKPGGRIVVADFNPGQKDDRRSRHTDTTDNPAEQLTHLLDGTEFSVLQIETLAFPRDRHGWSGVTLISAKRS